MKSKKDQKKLTMRGLLILYLYVKYVSACLVIVFTIQQAACADVNRYLRGESSRSGRFLPRYLKSQEAKHHSIISQKNQMSEFANRLQRNQGASENNEETTPLKQKRGGSSPVQNTGSQTYEIDGNELHIETVLFEEVQDYVFEEGPLSPFQFRFDFNIGGQVLTLWHVSDDEDGNWRCIANWDGQYYDINMQLGDSCEISSDVFTLAFFDEIEIYQDKYIYEYTDGALGTTQHLALIWDMDYIMQDFSSMVSQENSGMLTLAVPAGSALSGQNSILGLSGLGMTADTGSDGFLSAVAMPLTQSAADEAGAGAAMLGDIQVNEEAEGQLVAEEVATSEDINDSQNIEESSLEDALDLIAFIMDPKMLEVLENIIGNFSEIKGKTVALLENIKKRYYEFWNDELKGQGLELEQTDDAHKMIEQIESHIALIKDGTIKLSADKISQVLLAYNKMREDSEKDIKEYLNEIRGARKVLIEISGALDGDKSRVYKKEEEDSFKAIVSLKKKAKPRRKPEETVS